MQGNALEVEDHGYHELKYFPSDRLLSQLKNNKFQKRLIKDEKSCNSDVMVLHILLKCELRRKPES